MIEQMVATKDEKMGRFSVELKLANNVDIIDSERGLISPDKIRQVTIKGLVDTGATDLVIPADVAEKLDVRGAGEVLVRYADDRMAKRRLVNDVQVELLGRTNTFQAIVIPNKDSAIIGAIVLESLDLIVDCTNQTLIPRNPDYIIAEM